MVVEFFEGGYLPRDITSTTLVLLPKTHEARALTDYRPISLCNFSGKIVSKILANRLGTLLPGLISEEQSGFVSGRNIAPHIVMAQELIRDIDRKSTGGNVCFKLDMAKAYDRLEWPFLLRTMKAFGFSEIARDLIYRIICSIDYSFFINGETVGNVRSSRGVRQGDPLSPLLFVLAQQVLTVNLNRKIRNGEISSYKVGRQELPISHLLYADDVLVFTNGASRSLHNLMRLLRSYEKSSGQFTNTGKSSFYIGKRTLHRAAPIANITGITKSDFPIRYLGVPIFAGRSRLVYFEHLVDKVRRKLDGWKAKILSFAGKLTLLKAVLSSVPIYTLASSYVPITIIKRIEQIMSHFLWNSRGERRMHWVNWDAVCSPKEEGGLGVRRLAHIQQGLHGKLMWLVLQGDTLWGRFARSKYFRGNYCVSKHTTSPLWNSIASHESTLRSIGQWVVGRGDISFWSDNWLGEVLEGPLPCDVNLKVREAISMLPHLRDYIPGPLEDKIRDIIISPDHEDRYKFTLADDGKFSTKIYMAHIRHPGHKRAWVARIWHTVLPPKITTFLWKLMQLALPLDSRIMERGIQIASQCRCCKTKSSENFVHLFVHSEIAREVWRCFGEIFRLPTTFLSIGQLIATWIPKVGNLSQFDICRAGIASFSLWEIWVARCAATFDGTVMKARRICLKVISQVQLFSIIHLPKNPSSRIQMHILGILGIQAKQRRIKRGTWCCWSRPSRGRHKLNVDGSARNGEITGGGIVRDDCGNLVASFSYYYGQGTIMKAEYLALLDGLSLCTALEIWDLDVECDSKVVVTAIRDNDTTSWAYTQILRPCIASWRDSFEIRHIFREANRAADRFADLAHLHKTRIEYFTEQQLPASVRKAIHSDRIGILSFRP